MKKIISLIVALVALPGSALFAQTITGTWQGTLQAGTKELRIMFKISTTDADSLKAVMYSIDQAAQGFPASTVSVQNSAVKILIPGIGGTYDGKLSADGSSITGTWSQGQAMPLVLTHATSATAWSLPEPPAKPKPMAASVDPVFEVATIKPSKPDTQAKGFGVQGRMLNTINTSLGDMISFAYGIHPRQITGAPAWLAEDRFDVMAKPEGEGEPNQKQWKVMLQKMLADRFQLAFHRDKKELSVYSIAVGKTGSKLIKSEADPNGLPGIGFRGLGLMNARNASMADFAALLQGTVVDRPVVDQTGLAGKFDFALNWTPDEFQFANLGIKMPPPAANVDALPDLFTAMQQQLGLKLEATKTPVEIFVIDKVEKPSAN